MLPTKELCPSITGVVEDLHDMSPSNFTLFLWILMFSREKIFPPSSQIWLWFGKMMSII